MERIVAVILAAGKGTRMGDVSGSEIPKVMYKLLGIPIIDYCVNNIRNAGIQDIILIDGYKKEILEDHLGDKVKYAFQEEQLGTGHAVMMAEDQIKDRFDAVLVCNGDMPLFKSQTISAHIDRFVDEKPAIAMLSVDFKDPVYWAYGRIKRDSNNNITEIVEQKDCNDDELSISESNAGFYIFNSDWLWKNIHSLSTQNVQKEFYLTDMIKIAIDQGKNIIAVPVQDETEALGINTQEQLKQAEKVLQHRVGRRAVKSK